MRFESVDTRNKGAAIGCALVVSAGFSKNYLLV